MFIALEKRLVFQLKKKKAKMIVNKYCEGKVKRIVKYTLNYFFKANISSNILYLLYNGSINLIIKRCLVIKTRNYVSYLLTD